MKGPSCSHPANLVHRYVMLLQLSFDLSRLSKQNWARVETSSAHVPLMLPPFPSPIFPEYPLQFSSGGQASICQRFQVDSDTETQTETQRHRDTETQRHRDTETQRHRDTDRERSSQTEKLAERDTGKQRHRQRHRQTETQTVRDTDRQAGRQADRTHTYKTCNHRLQSLSSGRAQLTGSNMHSRAQAHTIRHHSLLRNERTRQEAPTSIAKLRAANSR